MSNDLPTYAAPYQWGVLMLGTVIGVVIGFSEALWLVSAVGWRAP